MGLLSRQANGYDNTTGATTTTTTHGTHHPTRDGVIAGGLAHHEASNHPTRDALLAGGAVGELQHHRNEKELRANNVGTHGINNTADPYSSTGTGIGHHNHNGVVGNGTGAGYGTGAATGAGVGTGVGATGAGVGTGAGATGAGVGTHTGPAPLHGVNGSAKPTMVEASKLERKGKLEHTMGGLLCSSSLKAKSATHLAQADHMRMQASELNEAEALEHQAGMRRQRAVGLGADPVHASGQTGFGNNNRTAAVA